MPPSRASTDQPVELSADPSAGPVWTVAAVARRFGVSPSTLRTWSLRYGIGPTGHHPGRHRRYTAADVAELETMLRLVEQGMALAGAADTARSRHRGGKPPAPRVAGSAPGHAAAELVPELVAAASELDAGRATDVVSGVLAAHGVVVTWDELCRPAFAALTELADAGADAGADGAESLDALMLLQWAVSTGLRRAPARPAGRGATRMLLACAQGEQHTLALEALHAALVERGVDVRMLGASAPGYAVLAAAERLRPDAAVVFAQTAATAAPALLQALAETTPTVVAAGPGWTGTRLPPGVRHVDSLVDALVPAAGFGIVRRG